jgi:two-component system, cell cycle sensor histidine kinase and response regulator CckA
MKDKDSLGNNGRNPPVFPVAQEADIPFSDYRDLFNTIPDAIFRISLPSGTCEYFNSATIRLFGTTSEPLNGDRLFFRKHIPADYIDQIDQLWSETVSGKRNGTVKYPICDEMGTTRWIRQYIRIIRDEDDLPVAAECIATDIGDSVKRSSEMEALLKFPSENPSPVFRISVGGTITYFNAASREILDEHWKYRHGTHVKEHWRRLVEKVLSDGCIRTVEIRTGKSIFSLAFTPVADSSYVNVYGTDITDQKHAFDEIDKLSKFPTENPNPVLRIDSNGVVLFANKSSEPLLSYWQMQPDNRIGETWRSVIKDILTEGVPREIELQIKTIWLSLSFAPVITRNFVNIYGSNITERKKIETNLKYANNSLSAFRDIATLKNSDKKTICDTTLHAVIRMTRSKIGVFGLLNSDESVITIESVSHPLISESVFNHSSKVIPVDDIAIFSDSLRQRRAIIRNDCGELLISSKALSGEQLRITRLITIPVFSENRIVAIVMVADCEEPYTDTDIVQVNALCESVWTIIERIHAENALRENTEKYHATFQEARDAIIVFTTERKIVDGNRSLSYLSGYALEEVLDFSLADLFPDTSPDAAKKRMVALTCGETIPIFEEKLYTKNGTIVPVEIAIATMRNCYGYDLVFQGTVRDITDRKKAEEAVRNSQRLESLGVLAGGIAHDFNNLLSGIFGNLDLALDSIDNKEEATGYLEKSTDAITRAKELTQQLLTFSRGGAPRKSSISLESLINESCSFAMSGSSIGCSTCICDDLYNIDADPNQICQVLNNLLHNARQAMSGNGTIRLDANNIYLAENQVPQLAEGYYVKLSVTDEGTGIPEEIIPKVFDPFFTTKANGSGLGLSTCHSIISRHKGGISIKSVKGKGTEITIYLPASIEMENTVPPHSAAPRLFHGRVLVMDDEELLLDVATSLFSQLGMEVTCASDGKEALNLFKTAMNDNHPFALVFLDLTVPGGMGGEQTMAEIRRLSPLTPGIVASGYADSPILSEPGKYGFAGKIEKPFRKSELQQVLESVLHLAPIPT